MGSKKHWQLVRSEEIRSRKSNYITLCIYVTVIKIKEAAHSRLFFTVVLVRDNRQSTFVCPPLAKPILGDQVAAVWDNRHVQCRYKMQFSRFPKFSTQQAVGQTLPAATGIPHSSSFPLSQAGFWDIPRVSIPESHAFSTGATFRSVWRLGFVPPCGVCKRTTHLFCTSQPRPRRGSA